ncbi:I78 family peptidase inhibitor [Vannielia sp.]|uniref:I78 family peptidase inhibitor n=1 Tax=Vannielia sp. TaxID=2813045 RepID=UPI0026356714|nr:I78 family peptidase inhibitor [Vannielia sp.]MDF1872366.1 I78 family peptidase inhibitor [Vannielia sp.]
MKSALPLILLLAVAGCQPAYEEGGPTDAGADPSGLLEREPDTCGASNQQVAVGQPASVISTLGIRGTTRTVQPGAIITQEYNPSRMNFYLDGNGVITRVSCG